MISSKIIIEPGRIEKNYWRDLWAFRELFYILSWRDIKVRYKQTVLGAAWSIIRPLLATLIFTFVFNRMAKLQAPAAVPYALLVMTGMLPWQFFSSALSDASNSLIGNTNLISKVYFPRLIIPASSIMTSLVDFAITFFILLAMMVYYQFVPDIKIFLLPFFILMSFFASLGVGLYITALNVKYRDFRYIIPFVMQIGLYVTPVGFSSSIVPAQYRLLYSLNPMVGIVDGFRWCIIGEEPLYLSGLAISITVIFMFLFLGIWYFRRTEKSFADNI
jgi:lipopolysaccharide transport system permease protein